MSEEKYCTYPDCLCPEHYGEHCTLGRANPPKWGSLIDVKLLKFEPDTLTIRNSDKQIIRIDLDGRVFWNGREVETDEDFRGAMMEMREYFMGRKT